MAVIYGDDLANDLSGTAGADSIYGLGGNDTLRANYKMGSVDQLYGGLGDDVYFYDLTSLNVASYKGSNIHESQDQGQDTLSLLYVPEGGNYFTSVGQPQNIEIFDVNGAITMIGGNDASNEIHANLYGLPASVSEAVTINGFAGDDTIFGSIYGDFINGGSGADGMAGGKGDDYYMIDNADDLVIELSGQGYDWIECDGVDYRMSSNVEALSIYGLGMTYYGNRLANRIESLDNSSRIIKAGAGSDVVIMHGAADDLLIGGADNDTLQAGLGDDIYRTSGAFGRDEITDTGGDDAVEFDVNESTLWFSKNGNDLNVSVIGTQNGVTIKNWYSDSSAKIEEFYAGTGKLLTAAKVDSLVSAMSGFAQPSSTTLPANIQTALAPTLAAAWQ